VHLEKQNRLQMSQVFCISARLSLDGFALQGFYRAGPRNLKLRIIHR
jgi:hypothetical protein